MPAIRGKASAIASTERISRIVTFFKSLDNTVGTLRHNSMAGIIAESTVRRVAILARFELEIAADGNDVTFEVAAIDPWRLASFGVINQVVAAHRHALTLEVTNCLFGRIALFGTLCFAVAAAGSDAVRIVIGDNETIRT